MRKQILAVFLTISVVFLVVTGCSQKITMRDFLPEDIEEVTTVRSRYSNTNDELTISSISEWTTWINGLSIEHKSFDEDKAPNEVWAGGESFLFDINDGELSFHYVDFRTEAYILYDNEWYAVSNPTKPPVSE